MKNIVLPVLMAFLMLGSIGCKKIQNAPLEEGVYSGTFKATYTSGKKKEGNTSVTFGHGRYSCEGTMDRSPAGGAGVYEDQGDKLIFIDGIMWTGDFDWGLILNGEYAYTYDGVELRIWNKREGATYEYILQRN